MNTRYSPPLGKRHILISTECRPVCQSTVSAASHEHGETAESAIFVCLCKDNLGGYDRYKAGRWMGIGLAGAAG